MIVEIYPKYVYLFGKRRSARSLQKMMLHVLDILHEGDLPLDTFPQIFCRTYREYEILSPCFTVEKADYVMDLDGYLVRQPIYD